MQAVAAMDPACRPTAMCRDARPMLVLQHTQRYQAELVVLAHHDVRLLPGLETERFLMKDLYLERRSGCQVKKPAHRDVRLLPAAGAPRALPVAQHAPHLLHLPWGQRRVQVGLQASRTQLSMC